MRLLISIQPLRSHHLSRIPLDVAAPFVLYCTILYKPTEKEVTMREQEPMTQTLKASEARQNFSQLINQVFKGETRVLVEKSGIPVAAIISAEDLKRLTQLEAEWNRDFAVIDEIRDAFKEVPDDELEREVARAVVSARGRIRAESRGAR